VEKGLKNALLDKYYDCEAILTKNLGDCHGGETNQTHFPPLPDMNGKEPQKTRKTGGKKRKKKKIRSKPEEERESGIKEGFGRGKPEGGGYQ